MNKGQGFAVTAFLAAALLLRPTGSPTPQGPETPQAAGSTPSPAAPTAAQAGPWIASCKYWAPTRLPDNQSPKPAEAHGTLDVRDGEIDLHGRLVEADEQKELGCGNEPFQRWGFPSADGPVNVTAVIATVPDPVHAHLALAFDRTVDAILQAATDNDYVSSYYWLPWKNRGGGLKFAESPGDAEPGHYPERERQPGLLILKPGSGVVPPRSFYNVIYLFLVAETPTQGVDGFQLQNAFLYEEYLKLTLTAQRKQFSTGPYGSVAIIGPQYSGSAASLRAGIETVRQKSTWTGAEFEVTGATTTLLPAEQLETGTSKVHFLSFADNWDYGIQTFVRHLSGSGYDIERVALLVEDNTAAASSATGSIADWKKGVTKIDQVIQFPREISLLRNAQVPGGSGNAAVSSGEAFSPYLHFSLKDYSAQDNIPQFSRENTPLSQEAQLMTIGRQLDRFRVQFIAIRASNVLDRAFLAQFLHRACPDARLLFFEADLLMVREIDNVPFIGSITITPYPLIGLRAAGRAYPDSGSEAYYNAVSYTFRRSYLPDAASYKPVLQGHRSLLRLPGAPQPSLWATAIGKDGYYPLAILAPRASDNPKILPPNELRAAQKTSQATVYPSLLWAVPWVFACVLCIAHTLLLLGADYWSPFTRELAIGDNDQPRRRSMYIQVAAAMLFSMVFVVSFPVLWLSQIVRVGWTSAGASVAALGLGLLTVIVSFWKTRKHIGWCAQAGGRSEQTTAVRHAYDRLRANGYLLLNLAAWTALIGVPCLWGYLCCTGSWGRFPLSAGSDLFGFCFCYRSIHPGSGISPILPVLLLLFGWYLWSVSQTLRLRFSEDGRPRLPKQLPKGLRDEADVPLFVSDDELDRYCLDKNITCLLITREVIGRFLQFRPVAGQSEVADDGGRRGRRHGLAIDIVLGVLYAGLLVSFSLFTPMHSLDHFLWRTGPHLSCPYEFLVGGLFFPLIVVALTGFMRMILIWGALKRGLLERLESMPIRFAFNRLKVMGWMTMLRSGGLQEQWRDMARGLESIRQMLHQRDLKWNISQPDWLRLDAVSKDLQEDIQQLRSRIAAGDPSGFPEHNYSFVRKIELGLAAFSQELLSIILIPYWKNERGGLVESEDIPDASDKPRRSQTRGPGGTEPARILAAEEFLAIRYISLIRSVLTNLRYLMIFVSATFVLTIWAWNSYPFQPRQLVDWLFTGLLVVLGSGVVWVFAQMHRNAILSRITDTRANELGWDFYIRVVSFGALPVFTWLAYQFPDIGNLISKFLQPGVPVIK